MKIKIAILLLCLPVYAWAEGIPSSPPQSALTPGTDYVTPTGDGSNLTQDCTTAQGPIGGGVGVAFSCNGTTGVGNYVLKDGPTIVTPTISGTGWTNATHAHTATSSAGTLTPSAIVGTAYSMFMFGAAGAPALLANGTNDYTLQATGASSAPEWVSAPNFNGGYTVGGTAYGADASGNLSALTATVASAANPCFTGNDSDDTGSNENTFQICGNETTTTDAAEYSDFWLAYKAAGAWRYSIWWDSSDAAMYIGASDTAFAAVAGLERLKWDFDTATDNQVAVSSDSGVTAINTGTIALQAPEVDSDFIPLGVWCTGGSVAPGAWEPITGTLDQQGRSFSGSANNDVHCVWVVPPDFTGTTVKVQVRGTVSAATAPANTEVIAFEVAAVCMANSEITTTAVGTAQTASLTADATYVQYDTLWTSYSAAITPAGSIAASERCKFDITRLATTTDTYAQAFHVMGIEVKYQRTTGTAVF